MYSGMNFLPFFISCEEHGDAEQFQKWYNEEVSQEKGCVKTKWWIFVCGRIPQVAGLGVGIGWE